tara:strand:+ start:136 stop:951 length:816 start_codon:yes stop_codon:yes gene_type:complete
MFQVNGKLSNSIDVRDRALHYGDGVFETIAVKKSIMEFWKEHYQRLVKGCKTIKIKCPAENFLKKEINKFIKKIKKEKFVLKIIISRGVGGRGYNPPRNTKPTRILGIYNWPKYPQINFKTGIKIGICETRISKQPYLSKIKHLNRLEQIIARSEWKSEKIFESIMLDSSENVIEGTMSNIFGVKKNIFYTPIIKFTGVEGVMREVILKLLEKNKKRFVIKKIKLKELLKYEEIFICNSVFGILPVKQILKKKIFFGEKTKEIINLLSEKK